VIQVLTIDTPSLGDPTYLLSATRSPAAPARPAQLAQIALRIADQPGQWLSLVRYDPGRRWYQRLARDDEHEIWLLSWLPGQHTGFHDHGPSAGAFAVARGFLRERAARGGRPEPTGRTLAPGAVGSFGPEYAHVVRNESAWPAVSIHAYSPPLSSIRRYSLAASGILHAAGEDRTW
jgi:predicted metal-dependent enzyme (double-stranded beta helix superfamily)